MAENTHTMIETIGGGFCDDCESCRAFLRGFVVSLLSEDTILAPSR